MTSSSAAWPTTPGVYKITNSINGRTYIGRAGAYGFYRRWADHRWRLRNNKHTNNHLQKAYNKYGEFAFTLSVIEEISDIAEQIKLEAELISTLKSGTHENGYNILASEGRGPYSHSSETREKLRKSATGKVKSPESRAKLSRSLKALNRKVSPEHRKKMVEGFKAKGGHSKEVRDKFSRMYTGKNVSEEVRQKIVKGLTGRPVSAETRNRIGSSNAKEFAVVSPTGRLHTGRNLSQFSRDNGLDIKGLSALRRGGVKSYKGWTNPPELNP